MGGILGAVGGQGQLPAAEFPPRFGQAVDLYVLRFGSGAAADGFLNQSVLAVGVNALLAEEYAQLFPADIAAAGKG